ncbi:MAG: hypothetical protein MJ245_03485 [Clostridia bacterium]|nr:hypothetical protein [Clostridia bacterium]
MLIDVSRKNKAKILSALFNEARLQKNANENSKIPMQEEEAKKLLEKRKTFDMLYGRYIGISFITANVETEDYDLVNGEGLAERIINSFPDEV